MRKINKTLLLLVALMALAIAATVPQLMAQHPPICGDPCFLPCGTCGDCIDNQCML
jgi:hypothetical protein